MEKFIDDEDKSFSQIFDLGFLPPFFLRLRNIPFESQSLQQIDCDEKKEKKRKKKKCFTRIQLKITKHIFRGKGGGKFEQILIEFS